MTNQRFPAVGGERGPRGNGSLMQIMVLSSLFIFGLSDLISGGVTLSYRNCYSLCKFWINLFHFQLGWLEPSFLSSELSILWFLQSAVGLRMSTFYRPPFTLPVSCRPSSPEAGELNPPCFSFLHLPTSLDFGIAPSAHSFPGFWCLSQSRVTEGSAGVCPSGDWLDCTLDKVPAHHRGQERPQAQKRARSFLAKQ